MSAILVGGRPILKLKRFQWIIVEVGRVNSGIVLYSKIIKGFFYLIFCSNPDIYGGPGFTW